MKFIVGVDPGARGALAIMSVDGQLLRLIDMPVVEVKVGKAMKTRVSPELLAHELRAYMGEAHAWVEQVTAMPGQGVSSMFSFGRSLGVAEGVLAGNGLSLRYVSPAKWKKALGLSADKGVSRRRAIELWPDHRKAFERVKDDGRAEAALLAWWWWKREAGR